MGWESIGSVNTGEMPQDGDWIVFALGLARLYVLHVAGKPPPGHTLGICWHDHDLGEYPTLGVYCEFTPDMRYVGDCERALERFDAAVEWSAIKPDWDDVENFDDDVGKQPADDEDVG
ncbi:MAG: hypothetical protein PHP86_03820 [Nevskiales bacterium]|nr:hypothetical protein [Nevskiales bacterium]